MPATKATKKFQRKHLDDTIKRRRAHKQAAAKRKPRSGVNGSAAGTAPRATKRSNDDVIQQMSMDTFLNDAGDDEVEDDEDEADEIEDEDEGEDAASDVSDTGAHQNDLAGLEKQDPAFYKYLQDNDAELLNFNADDDEDMAADGADGSAQSRISAAQIQTLADSLANDSVKAFGRLATSFKHIVLSEDAVEDAAIAEQVVALALTEGPAFLQRVVPPKAKGNATETKKLTKLTPAIKTYLNTLLHLLGDLTDATMQRALLDSSLKLVPYTLSHRKFCRDFLRSVVSIWSTSPDTGARLSAYLLAKEYAGADATIRQLVLREMYSAFVRECRSLSAHNADMVQLMKNSASDLFGHTDGYAVAFGFIRQLAILLRKAINDKTEEARRGIASMQFTQSIDFWAITLSKHPSLDELVYPLVQVALGAVRTITSPANYPMRFHIVSSLIRLSEARDVYIPLAGLLWDVLDSAEMRRKAKPSTIKPMALDLSVRAKAEYLRTAVYQDQLGERTCDLLAEFFAVHARSPAFPELVVPLQMQLKRYVKRCHAPKLARRIQALLDRLQANAALIEDKRRTLRFPKETTLDLKDTPLTTFVATQRKLQQDRRRLAASAEE